MTDMYPCIIYNRLRPAAPEASTHAMKTIWPLAAKLVKLENYSVFGRYGDSEYAPPFCGASELRPGYDAASKHANELASSFGRCTLIIENASPLGDGDPFMPNFMSSDVENPVHIRLMNFHLRLHARSTSLRSAWGYFNEHQRVEREKQLLNGPIELLRKSSNVEVIVKRDTKKHSASIFISNPTSQPLTIRWTQHMQMGHGAATLLGQWKHLTIPPESAGYLDTIFQGDQPWVRQLRIRDAIIGRNVLGCVHLSPEMMTRDRIPLIWENRDGITREVSSEPARPVKDS